MQAALRGDGRRRRALRGLHRLLHLVAVRATSGPTRPTRWPTSRPSCCSPPPGCPGATSSSATTSGATARCSTDGRCSIYEHRPRTCRTYDCRIFPATGLARRRRRPRQGRHRPSGPPVAVQLPDRRRPAAPRRRPGGGRAAPAARRTAATATQLAVRAIETYEEFL